jgi:rRNA maturation protein Nop10
MTEDNTEERTYKIKARCSNCGFANDVAYPVGSPVDHRGDYSLRGKVCCHCGCETLKQS